MGISRRCEGLFIYAGMILLCHGVGVAILAEEIIIIIFVGQLEKHQ